MVVLAAPHTIRTTQCFDQSVRQSIDLQFEASQVEAAPRADLLRRRIRMVTHRGEPSVEAGTTAEVLTLGTAEGVSGHLEANDALQLLLHRLEWLLLCTAPLSLACGVGSILHRLIHLLNFLLVCDQSCSQWYFTSCHICCVRLLFTTFC